MGYVDGLRKGRKKERQKDGKTERQKERKTEREKDRKTERQKDRKTERQKNRKTLGYVDGLKKGQYLQKGFFLFFFFETFEVAFHLSLSL